MVNINCKTTGTITAAGTANMEVIQIETVVLDTPHQTFDVSADPFGYFSLAEEASGDVAQFTVSIADVSGLKTALGGWLKGGALAAGQDVEAWMIEYLRGEINALVGTDGVGAALEAHVIKNLEFDTYDNDAQTGANNLVEALNGNQDHKDLIGLQFPANRFPETFASTLPAEPGDSMTFQFTIESNILVTDTVVDQVAAETNAATQATVVPNLDVTKSRIVHIVATK